jgi:predicted hotdog family 3-hydroxylacyl-ACP dehydratase
MVEPFLSVEQYLPHRSPMLLVDRLLADDGDRVEVEATVPADGLFVRDGVMPSWVGLELMAQTIGVFAGRRSRERHEAVRLGFLLGTRRYTAKVDGFRVGARLEIHARMEILSAQGLSVFDCCILEGGQVVAEALLNVFQPQDVDGYLKEEIGV